MPSRDAVPSLRTSVRWRRVGEEAVIVVQDAGRVVGLNGTGAAVLEAIDGRTTVDAILERLAPRWAVSREQLAEDVDRILDELVSLEILDVSTAAPSPRGREDAG